LEQEILVTLYFAEYKRSNARAEAQEFDDIKTFGYLSQLFFISHPDLNGYKLQCSQHLDPEAFGPHCLLFFLNGDPDKKRKLIVKARFGTIPFLSIRFEFFYC